MKVLFALRYSRNQASSRVRGFYMMEELKRRGISCDLVYRHGRSRYIHLLSNLASCNIIYFQKRCSRIDIKLNKLAKFLRKRTIFDIDDEPAGGKHNTKSEKRAIEMMKISSAVVVGSHRLKKLALNFNNHVYLIPSSINLNYYQPKKGSNSNDYVTLGWIGNGANYRDDLLMLVKPLEELGKNYNIKLILIGALGQKEIHKAFGKMRDVVVEIVDSIDWGDPMVIPSEISNFDIGLYPLLNNEFNQHKCGGKLLEYMAMGIPPVASPIGEIKLMIENGIDGFLASNEEEWKESITFFIENKEFRRKMGELGREKVKKSYSLEICASKLLKVFEELK